MSPALVCPLILAHNLVSPKFPDKPPWIQPPSLPKMHLFLFSEELLLIHCNTPMAQVTPPHLFRPNELIDLQLYMDFSFLPFFSCAVCLLSPAGLTLVKKILIMKPHTRFFEVTWKMKEGVGKRRASNEGNLKHKHLLTHGWILFSWNGYLSHFRRCLGKKRSVSTRM